MKEEAETSDADTADETTGTRNVQELESRCRELEQRLVRAQADYQNSRRRAQQELDAALLRALQPLLQELLLVGDYLDLALASKATSEDAAALAQGVALTRSKLTNALELADVRPIPTDGPFDPSLHEAVDSRPGAGAPAGTILEVLQPGYTWQQRILRPARVVVASGPREDS
jgi:molecular chaperone GrpE